MAFDGLACAQPSKPPCRKTCGLGPTVRAMIKSDISGAWPVLHEFGSSGGDFWFCMTVLSDSRAAAAARPDES